ncbi:MAG: hypothetical protein ACOVNZ_10795 [Crocinitomicaceae bacterium]|jgi:hypothetical protein
MKKVWFINLKFIGLLFFISACVNGDVLQKIDYTYSFCDGNSKVWMVNSVNRGNDFLDARIDLTSKVFVFYKSEQFIYGNLQDLFNNHYEKGTYLLESENNFLELKFPNKKWAFIFEFVDENHLILKPEKSSESDLTFELIPFPEPN